MAQVKHQGKITDDVLKETFQMLEVDPVGLDDSDRRLILAIIEKHSGGPVGIETLAASISEDIGTVEEVLEPYLMQIGFLKRTPRGRVATVKAYQHLGKKMPENKKSEQEGLF